MIRGSLSLLLFGATFLSTHSLVSSTCAMCIAWLTVLIGYDFRRARAALLPGELCLLLDWRAVRRLFVLSLPLGLVMTLISLNTNIPRYLLDRFCGTEELGIFASLAYLMVALNLVVNALCHSATTRLSGMFSEQRFDDYCRLLVRLSTFGVIVVLAGVPLSLLCGRSLLTILYRPQYGNYPTVLAILVAASGVGATAFFLTSGLNAARCFRAQLPIFVASNLTTMLGCFILVPSCGLSGAATALLLSATVGLLGNLMVLNATLRSASTHPIRRHTWYLVRGNHD